MRQEISKTTNQRGLCHCVGIDYSGCECLGLGLGLSLGLCMYVKGLSG